MSKHKSNKRKLFIAKWAKGGVLITKAKSDEEVLAEVVSKVPNINIYSVTIYEVKHSKNEVYFKIGD